MKKLLGIMAVALLSVSTCQAVDYSRHFYDQRVYRVALGSGVAPTAADMALIRLQNGEMVLNTSDNVLYIMHATNVYTKITAAGVMTVTTTGTGDDAFVVPAHSIGVGELPAMTTGQILVGDTSDSNANVVASSGVTYDAVGAASVAASAINSGDIDGARMSANGVVAADFTQNSGVLVGTGAGTYAEETGDTLRTSLGLAIGTDVLAPTGDGTNLTGVALDTEVFGSADITIGAIAAAQRITTNSIAMLDTAGTAKASEALIEVWVSETAKGTASTNNIESLTLSGGSAVRTILADASYMYVADTNGTATATITGSAAGTNYLNVSVGANVTAEAIVLTD